jgi:hypothetical protein
MRTHKVIGNEPGNARGKHPRLATARTRQDQGMRFWQDYGFTLGRIQAGKQVGHEEQADSARKEADIVPALAEKT